MMQYNPAVTDRRADYVAQAANTTANAYNNLGETIGDAIKQFAGAYAENKALDAKAAAYGDFLNRHGSQLGLDPEWIKGFAKAPRDQKLAAGDLLTGQVGQQFGRMEYLNRQADLYGYGGGGGASGVGGERRNGGTLYDFED